MRQLSDDTESNDNDIPPIEMQVECLEAQQVALAYLSAVKMGNEEMIADAASILVARYVLNGETTASPRRIIFLVSAMANLVLSGFDHLAFQYDCDVEEGFSSFITKMSTAINLLEEYINLHSDTEQGE